MYRSDPFRYTGVSGEFTYLAALMEWEPASNLPPNPTAQPALKYQVAIMRGEELVRAMPPVALSEYTDAAR